MALRLFADYITSYASARGEFAGIPKVNPLKEAVLWQQMLRNRIKIVVAAMLIWLPARLWVPDSHSCRAGIAQMRPADPPCSDHLLSFRVCQALPRSHGSLISIFRPQPGHLPKFLLMHSSQYVWWHSSQNPYDVANIPGNIFVAGLPPGNCEMEIGLLHLLQKATGISSSFVLHCWPGRTRGKVRLCLIGR